jgi:Na+/H+ antiporter NhaD/arsenite permease-like protein
MFLLIVLVFVLGYAAIALEHPLRVDKAATALIIGMVTWAMYVLFSEDILALGLNEAWVSLSKSVSAVAHDPMHFVKHELEHHLIEIAEILFFLLGAMTIVEVVDRHGGFKIITDRIRTKNKVKLLWIFSVLTFFMSAALDNLTTTIVMLALLRKIIADKETRWMYAAMVVLASNSGGAWSPIGDVTTIMLWIGEQVSAQGIIVDTFLPSLVNMLVPVIIMSFFMKGEITSPDIVSKDDGDMEKLTSKERNILFFVGIVSLLFVPVFKSVTHLPPYVGMLLGLGNIWLVTEVMHRNKSAKFKQKYSVVAIIKHVDVATVFFFLGILTAVSALQSAGHLSLLADFLDQKLGNIYAINLVVGVLSAIVDNVPLVAGAMGMYDIAPADATGYLAEFVHDGNFWKFLAYCAGTGGSILIIGSAAGVAAMGIEKIDFIWYVKRVSLLALTGYIGGAITYYIIHVL